MSRQATSLRALTQAFGRDVLRHRRLIAWSYVCRAVAIAASLFAPWALKLIIDNGILTGAPALPWLGDLDRGTLVLALTALFFLSMLVYAVAGAAEKNASAVVRERLTLELRDRLLAHLLTLSPTLRTRERSGELVLRILDDADLFVRVLTKTVPQLFQHVLTLVATLAVMLWVSTLVGLLGIVWLPVVAVVLRKDARRLWKASREKRAREGHVSALAQEIIRGMAMIQASGDGDTMRGVFRGLNVARMSAGRAETSVAVSLERTLQLIQGLALSLAAGGGAWLVLRGRLTLGDLTLLTAYITQLFKPLEKLNDLAETTGRGVAGGDRLLLLLAERPTVVDNTGCAPLARVRGVIDLENVCFEYAERKRPILTNVAMRLQPGMLTVLVGRSGEGKSTLLSLLVRLADPTRGTIRLDGRDITTIALRELRDQFAVLSQDSYLFSGTVRSALTPSDRSYSEIELWRALELVSLSDLVRHLPGQLDEPIGEDGVNLSGGQRRRLSLARVFLLRRPIVLLDEPLANIDGESAAVVLDAIDHLSRRSTCLAVTHDDALVARAGRVFRLDGGRIRERRPFTITAAALQA